MLRNNLGESPPAVARKPAGDTGESIVAARDGLGETPRHSHYRREFHFASPSPHPVPRMRHAVPENASFDPFPWAYNPRRYASRPSRLHQNLASSGPQSSAMSENIISPEDAGLMLHKFVTEGIPVFAYFVSADRSVSAKFNGFASSFTREKGLVISTDSPLSKAETLLSYIRFSHGEVASSQFTYADETGVPKDSLLGSGLAIHFLNGDTLTIVEIRSRK
jgi:hypothetical protein